MLVRIVNSSLSDSCVPSSLKEATISPLLKKPTLDPENLKNYRRVYNLPYITKLIEKVVVRRINAHMYQNNLHENYQSAYRQFHSTETALLKVYNDICMAIDGKKCVFLVLLDLSAAFDTVDHPVLLHRFRSTLGMSGNAFQWRHSYFQDRSQRVNILGSFSEPRPLEYGMPQGSVVGPFGFSLYTIPVGQICRKHGIPYHFYADDTQLYLPFDLNEEALALSRLEACIQEVREWMRVNYLKLNDSKTEFMIIRSPHTLKKTKTASIKIGDEIINPSHSARNIGAIFDDQLSMKNHIASVTKSCYYHLRNISKIRKSLTQNAANTLIHSFLTSKIDYLNSLLIGLPEGLIQNLQKIQNVAARIVTGCPKRQHIKPVLKELHWLPVKSRINYKILLLTFKALHGLAPQYLRDLITPYVPTRCLQSENQHLLSVPHIHSKTGERTFAWAGPHLWNSLPHDLREISDVNIFKSHLKTYLFQKAFY